MCFLQTYQVFFLNNLSRLFFAPCVTCDVISAQRNQINVSGSGFHLDDDDDDDDDDVNYEKIC